MSNREKLPEWIVRFNEKDLTEHELESFLGMMGKYPRIEREVRLDADLNAVLAEDDLIDLQSKIQKAISPAIMIGEVGRKLFMLAAALVVLMTLELVISHLCSRHAAPPRASSVAENQQGTELRQTKEIVPVTLPDKEVANNPEKTKEKQAHPNNTPLLAENFRPNPVLEPLVGTVTRAGFFSLLSPVSFTLSPQQKEIRIRWETSIETTLKIVIVDNKGETRFETEVVEKDHALVSRSGLVPGLYYYKIIQNEELICLGRITVK